MPDWFETMIMPSWVGKLALGVGTLLIGGVLTAGISSMGDVREQGVRLTTVEREVAIGSAQRSDVMRLIQATREDAAEFRGTAKAISKQLDSIESRIMAREVTR